jgi:hypothetical protein
MFSLAFLCPFMLASNRNTLFNINLAKFTELCKTIKMKLSKIAQNKK